MVGSVAPDDAAAAPAVTPDNRPTPVAGHENGRLPASELIQVTAGCRAYRPAAGSISTLLALGRRSGVPIHAAECYRSIDGQLQAERTNRPQCVANTQRDASGRPVGTSMHGWGKAIDAAQSGRSLTFSSEGYRFLRDHAARFGWNHPRWAWQGSSTCEEPWHWEWVGDGGRDGGDPVKADVVGLMRAPTGWTTVTALGALAHSGPVSDHGSTADTTLNWVVVGGARTPSGKGYWLVGADGGVFAFGDAGYHGSTGGLRLNQPVVGMAAAPDGKGYWLVAEDGGIFAFGSARFLGSTGNIRLNRPVVGMAATPDGLGYWLVASDGGIFAFGSAPFLGSTGNIRLNEPIMGMAATSTGRGYWMVASDGGVFTFGDGVFHGSFVRTRDRAPAVAISRGVGQNPGYLVAFADGTVEGAPGTQ